MGSGVWPLAVATRLANPSGQKTEDGGQRTESAEHRNRKRHDLYKRPDYRRQNSDFAVFVVRPPASVGSISTRQNSGVVFPCSVVCRPCSVCRAGFVKVGGKCLASGGGRAPIGDACLDRRLMGACRCTPAVFRLSPADAWDSVRIGRVRAISTGRLRGLLRFHFRPIDVVVFHGSRRDLVLRRVSRLDAFSGYPVRT